MVRLVLDIALGVSGYPKGRVIEIYGPESSGKNQFYHARDCRISKTRRELVKRVDAEMLFDAVYVKN